METLELKNFYKDKKVFVTGHTGFKGSWLISLLDKLGAKVCGYSLEPNTKPNLFELINGKEIGEHHIGDIRDYDKLLSVMQDFQPEIVFHLAAQPIVLVGYQNPRGTYETNIMGTVNVMEAIRYTPSVKSVVNITTDKVYLNNDTGHTFTETDALCGFDPYSNSKSCSELVTYSYKKSFLDNNNIAVSTARAGNVIGGGDWSDYRLIPDCIKSFIKDETIVIRNPDATRPFQYVLEPLYLYLVIAMKQHETFELSGNYNIGPDIENCVSVKQLIETLYRYQPKLKCVVNIDKNAKHEAKRLELDNTRAKDVLGYRPVYTIDETIKNIVDWTNAYIAGKDMKMFTNKQIDAFLEKINQTENLVTVNFQPKYETM